MPRIWVRSFYSEIVQRMSLLLARLYGPAVRCKQKVMQRRGLVLRICIRPVDGAWAPGHDGYPRALDLNSRPGPEGHTGHLITNSPAGPFFRHLFRLADLGGKPLISLYAV
jgi:hypothetical protein